MKPASKSALTMLATLSLIVILWTPAQLAAQAAHASVRYYVTDLGTLSGGNFSQPFGVNIHGTIIGSSNLANNDQHATLWSKGEITDLGTLGGSNSIGFGINNSGVTVGEAESSASDPNGEDFCGFGTHLICQPFVWQNNVMTPLPTLRGNNGVVNWINRWGTAVGQAEDDTADPKCQAPQVLHFLPVHRRQRLHWPRRDVHQRFVSARNNRQRRVADRSRLACGEDGSKKGGFDRVGCDHPRQYLYWRERHCGSGGCGHQRCPRQHHCGWQSSEGFSSN